MYNQIGLDSVLLFLEFHLRLDYTIKLFEFHNIRAPNTGLFDRFVKIHPSQRDGAVYHKIGVRI